MSVAVRAVGAPELRYERNFVVPASAANRIESALRLHPARFEEAYAPRFVNSLYFDTLDLRHYFDAVDGEANRRKFRLRWYGRFFGAPEIMQLEIKRKHGQVGSKTVQPIRDFEMKAGVSGAELARTFASYWSAETDQRLEPVLMNRYHRRYWVSRDGRFRITVDSDIRYRRVARVRNGFLRPVRPGNARILELKYAVCDDDAALGVARAVTYRISRHSKYGTGIERLYAHRCRVGAD